jgi:hypothetical protein
MPIENLQNWYLKKHENGEVFGPVHFDKIREWARTAQVNPQDMVSNDQVLWTRPPMIPELEMDWLVELGEDLLYGPTTSGTLMEFVRTGEISKDTIVINCVDGSQALLRDTEFFSAALAAPPTEHAGADIEEEPTLSQQPIKGGIRANLQRRVRELEQSLLEKQRYLNAAKDIIARLEARNKELEDRLREASGFAKKKK